MSRKHRAGRPRNYMFTPWELGLGSLNSATRGNLFDDLSYGVGLDSERLGVRRLLAERLREWHIGKVIIE